MNEVITLLQEAADKTPAQLEALSVDHDLRVQKSLIESGLLGMSHDLKVMRDRKLYAELGYETFEDYTETEHGIKSRQAYKYIYAYEQLGEEVLHSSAKLGITKLDLLASLDTDERGKLFAEHSVEELDIKSTAEYKELLSKYEQTVEQLTMFEGAPLADEQAAAEYPDVDALVEARLEVERANIERAAEESARKAAAATQSEEIEKLKKKAREATEKAKAVAEEKKAAEAAAAAALKDKEEAEKARKEAENAAGLSQELADKLRAEQERSAAMEKQIRLSADPELTRFKYLFESWQAATKALAAQLVKLPEETREKMKTPVRKVMEVNGL